MVEAAQKQQLECKKVSWHQVTMGEVQRQTSQAEEVVERQVRPLEQAVLGLADTTDRPSQTESDVLAMRAAMADGNAKVEEIRREVMDLKVQLLECCRR
jgi:hypothetical protein